MTRMVSRDRMWWWPLRFGGDHGGAEMSQEREYPAWDGQPLAELPRRAFTDPGEFLSALGKQNDFPEAVNEDFVALFTEGVFLSLRAAEVKVHPDGLGLVTLWLPFFHDERMFEPGGHTPLSTAERWCDAESAMSVAAQATPTGPVRLGFSLSMGEPVSMPWYEYCEHYDQPPEHVWAAWKPELDDE